jgi:transglutaminase-like putative cysteine protease
MRSPCRAALFCLLCLVFPLKSFALDLGLNLAPVLALPIADRDFQAGFGAAARLDWAFLSPPRWSVGLGLDGSYFSLPVPYVEAASFLDGALGPFFRWKINDRFVLEAGANAGVYGMSFKKRNEVLGHIGGGLAGEYRISPYFSVRTSLDYARYNNNPALNLFSVSAGLRINLGEVFSRESRLDVERVEQERIFPVSYAWYEQNPFSVLRITNNEPNDITEMELSFFLDRYMNQPIGFASIAHLRRGEETEAPVTALFNESMLGLIENTPANAVVRIEYRSLGARKELSVPLAMTIYHRNAMSWDDDRRAASFVSSRDPAAVYFARHTAALVRKELRPGIPENIQYALALFSALAACDISYSIDPASSYAELSENASAVDSLNYPFETLYYRGGDCDDLSILFCSLLEVLGIPTAFITIPGHIYAAFDTGQPELTEGLIEHDGKIWMPLEITILNQGFYTAWNTGRREWENSGSAGLIYPMAKSWELYPPVSAPRPDPWLPAMPEDEVILKVFREGLGRLGAR